jgi:protein phosphatase 2C
MRVNYKMRYAQAANFCADRLHHALAEEVNASVQGENASDAGVNWEARWQRAMSSCFLRMDAEVGGVCWRGGQCGQTDSGPRCCSEPIAPETVGSTAVIAVIGSCQIIVGNCGDSRAVLSRGGVAIPLSVDHKVCITSACVIDVTSNPLYLLYCSIWMLHLISEVGMR